jgi:hypothetical protein
MAERDEGDQNGGASPMDELGPASERGRLLAQAAAAARAAGHKEMAVAIAEQRVGDMGQMDADLVHPAGVGSGPHQREAACEGYGFLQTGKDFKPGLGAAALRMDALLEPDR